MSDCTDVLPTDNGDHPCAYRFQHRIHGCNCDLGLQWIRNPDGTADITAHMHRVSTNMRVSHDEPDQRQEQPA